MIAAVELTEAGRIAIDAAASGVAGALMVALASPLHVVELCPLEIDPRAESMKQERARRAGDLRFLDALERLRVYIDGVRLPVFRRVREVTGRVGYGAEVGPLRVVLEMEPRVVAAWLRPEGGSR